MKSRKLSVLLALLVLAAVMAGCVPSKPFTVGAFNGNDYSNDFFGMTFSLPEGWVIATDDEIKTITGATDEMLGKTDKDLSKEKTIYLAYASKYPLGYAGLNPTMNIVTTNLGLYGLTVKSNSDFLQQSLDELNKQVEGTGMSFEFSDIATQKIGGVDFAVVDSKTTISGIELNQRMLCTIRSNYALMVSFAWGDEGADDVQALVDSINFAK